MDKWQPIETAPKDGSNILLYVEDQITEGYFDNSEWSKEWKVVTLSSHGCGCCAHDLEQPTHWMPLPQPPKEGK